jgi:FKBP-type peptidyl-prolyl cis-trans isomerase
MDFIPIVQFDSSYKRGQPAQFGVGQVIKGTSLPPS